MDGWRLGLGICLDVFLPEHARAAALDGASAYLLSAASYVGSEHRRDAASAARALDNGLYVVRSGLTGRCGEASFSGGSSVHDPDGRLLAGLGQEAPGVVVADLDAAVVERVRERHGLLEQVRPNLGARTITAAC